MSSQGVMALGIGILVGVVIANLSHSHTEPITAVYSDYLYMHMYEDGSYRGELLNGQKVSGCVRGGLCED